MGVQVKMFSSKREENKKICKTCGSDDYYAKGFCENCYALNRYYTNHSKIRNQRNLVYQKNRIKIIEQVKKYYLNHKDTKKIYNSNYYKMNKNDILEQHKYYNKKNEYKRKEKDKIYQSMHKKERNLRQKERRKNDLNFRLTQRLCASISDTVKNFKGKKLIHTHKLLGCSIQDFRQHIEKQFKPGMTWQNYGFYGWHLDHILPCAHFDLKDLEQQKLCFHYSNYQPLWWNENFSKGAKILEEQEIIVFK
jgi:hypothetical protein